MERQAGLGPGQRLSKPTSVRSATFGAKRKPPTGLRKWRASTPKPTPKNLPQVKGVSNGEIQIGWVNHYYLHKLKAANPELKAANYSFQAQDAGNVMMLSGIGIVSHSSKQKPHNSSWHSFYLKPASSISPPKNL